MGAARLSGQHSRQEVCRQAGEARRDTGMSSPDKRSVSETSMCLIYPLLSGVRRQGLTWVLGARCSEALSVLART